MKLIAWSDQHMSFPLVGPAKYLIFAGDYQSGHYNDEDTAALGRQFLRWFGSLEGEYKLLVPGNHDHWFWKDKDAFRKCCEEHKICLLDQELVSLGGIRFYGSPYFYTPRINPTLKTDIPHPEAYDVLVTHAPPYGIYDFASSKMENCGGPELRHHVQMNKPKLHIFGHIHEGYGQGHPFYNVALASKGKTKNLIHSPTEIELTFLEKSSEKDGYITGWIKA